MGPHAANTDPLFDSLTRLKNYRAAHPEAIIAFPSDTLSGLWEVSLPDSATMAFGSIDMMLLALDQIDTT